MKKEVSVLIPAYNEEETIEATISAVQQISKIDEIIVINDGSTDRTKEIVKKTGVNLINLTRNSGKGRALNFGLEEAKGEIIVLIDADLGGTASELDKLLKPVIKEEVDVSIAKFPPAKKGGFGLVVKLSRFGIKLFTGMWFESPLSGQRVLTREVIEYLGKFEEGFGVEVAITIKALKAGFKVKEVPVTMTHRETGKTLAGFKHRGKQFLDVLTALCLQLRRGE